MFLAQQRRGPRESDAVLGCCAAAAASWGRSESGGAKRKGLERGRLCPGTGAAAGSFPLPYFTVIPSTNYEPSGARTQFPLQL